MRSAYRTAPLIPARSLHLACCLLYAHYSQIHRYTDAQTHRYTDTHVQACCSAGWWEWVPFIWSYLKWKNILMPASYTCQGPPPLIMLAVSPLPAESFLFFFFPVRGTSSHLCSSCMCSRCASLCEILPVFEMCLNVFILPVFKMCITVWNPSCIWDVPHASPCSSRLCLRCASLCESLPVFEMCLTVFILPVFKMCITVWNPSCIRDVPHASLCSSCLCLRCASLCETCLYLRCAPLCGFLPVFEMCLTVFILPVFKMCLTVFISPVFKMCITVWNPACFQEVPHCVHLACVQDVHHCVESCLCLRCASLCEILHASKRIPTHATSNST